MSDAPGTGSRVGQLSADGQLIWDGQAWQPVVASAPQPAPAPALPSTATPVQGSHFGQTAAIAIAALVIGGLGGFAAGQSTSPSQQSLAIAYVGVLHANGGPVGDAFLTMGSECTGGTADLSRCRAAAVDAQTATQKFLSELGRLSVPACLAPANEQLVAGLVMYSEGVTDVIAGLDANNDAQITTGAELANTGIPHVNNAAALVNASTCG